MGQQLALDQILPARGGRAGRAHQLRNSRSPVRRLPRQEARYGFRDDPDDDPRLERPRTLCFGCFRVELSRARPWPREWHEGGTARRSRCHWPRRSKTSNLRRRRAQIAARHALEAAG